MHRRRARLHVVDEQRQPRGRHPGDRARGIQRQLGRSELGARAAGGPVAANDASLVIDEEQAGRLVAHPVHQPLDGLLVDLFGIEGGVHRRAEIAQEGQLLDLRLEVAEFLLELIVRVDDLLGLQI